MREKMSPRAACLIENRIFIIETSFFNHREWSTAVEGFEMIFLATQQRSIFESLRLYLLF